MDHVIVYQTLTWHLEHGFFFPFLCFRCRKTRDTESTWRTKGKEQVMLLAGGLFCRSRWEMMPADLCPLLKPLLGWGWSAAGGQTPRAKEDSEEIVLVVTRSGRFLPKIFDQQQAEGLMSLEGPTWWLIIAGKAHHRLCMSVVLQGLQSCWISLLLSKEKPLWDAF